MCFHQLFRFIYFIIAAVLFVKYFSYLSQHYYSYTQTLFGRLDSALLHTRALKLSTQSAVVRLPHRATSLQTCHVFHFAWSSDDQRYYNYRVTTQCSDIWIMSLYPLKFISRGEILDYTYRFTSEFRWVNCIPHRFFVIGVRNQESTLSTLCVFKVNRMTNRSSPFTKHPYSIKYLKNVTNFKSISLIK